MEYGGYREVFRGDRRVDLTGVHALAQRYGDTLRVYPGSMELQGDGTTYTLGSRTVCTVGIGESIEEARAISLEGIRHIDGPLWNRWDIGARHLITQSVDRMKALRG
jgi:phosphoribosylamine-glycine ligase